MDRTKNEIKQKQYFLLKMSKHQLKFEINSNKTSFFFFKNATKPKAASQH